ncbi:MAG: hypothetical protein HY870_21560 [Chloroflexi bacterium]|nr:hypothetical protein [Chloroflexota bacterium]
MTNSLPGIPLTIGSLACLGIAAAYYFVWPKPKTGQARTRLQHLILRNAHSLVWVLLAVACLLWAGDSQSGLASVLGLAALGTYLLFMIMLFAGRKRNL